jgi:ATP-dependent Clp protease ATP-binding subunit ClpA
MFERARADVAAMKVVLPEAERLAKIDGVKVPAAEHLLLAAFTLDDGSAGRALATLGHDLDELIAALQVEGLPHSSGDPAPVDASRPTPRRATILRSGDSMQVMFQRVRKHAAAAKRPIREADFLVAAAQIDGGVVADALAALGIDREQLAAAAQRASS